jgi:hypothetical protein
MHYCPFRHSPRIATVRVRLACLIHAANVRSEPESNPSKLFALRRIPERIRLVSKFCRNPTSVTIRLEPEGPKPIARCRLPTPEFEVADLAKMTHYELVHENRSFRVQGVRHASQTGTTHPRMASFVHHRVVKDQPKAERKNPRLRQITDGEGFQFLSDLCPSETSTRLL